MSVVAKVRRLTVRLIKRILFKIEPQSAFSEDSEIRNYGYEIEYNDSYNQIILNGSPIRLRNQSSDFLVFQQVFMQEEYKKVVEIIMGNKVAINTIIDLGSNIGLTTLFLFQFFPKANFICVEPDSGNFDLMNFNLSSIKNVRTYKNAVWSEHKEVYLNRNFRDQKDWAISASDNSQESYSKADTITIDDLMKENGVHIIDLLKIDIEGSEKELFKDSKSAYFLEFTKILAIEIHDEFDVKNKIVSELLSRKFVLIYEMQTLIAINSFLIHNK